MLLGRIAHVLLALSLLASLGAGYCTENFLVSASTGQLAHEVGQAAERLRRELAIEWLGRELPRWSQPCPIEVKVSPHLGASGVTQFTFRGHVPSDWQMEVRGSRERVLDSVLPHEITHTIFATHFGRPLPRWADEGACTTVEHPVEKVKQDRLLVRFLTSERGIPFRSMFAMSEYPADIMPLYSQGYSLTRYLIQQGGRRKFVRFLGQGMETHNWTQAIQQHYAFKDLGQLQLSWVDWVRRGSPELAEPQHAPLELAAHEPAAPPVATAPQAIAARATGNTGNSPARPASGAVAATQPSRIGATQPSHAGAVAASSGVPGRRATAGGPPGVPPVLASNLSHGNRSGSAGRQAHQSRNAADGARHDSLAAASSAGTTRPDTSVPGGWYAGVRDGRIRVARTADAPARRSYRTAPASGAGDREPPAQPAEVPIEWGAAAPPRR